MRTLDCYNNFQGDCFGRSLVCSGPLGLTLSIISRLNVRYNFQLNDATLSVWKDWGQLAVRISPISNNIVERKPRLAVYYGAVVHWLNWTMWRDVKYDLMKCWRNEITYQIIDKIRYKIMLSGLTTSCWRGDGDWPRITGEARPVKI